MKTTRAMLLTFAKRYWLTLIGGLVITTFVVVSVFHLGTGTVGSLVETVMRGKGREFAELLTSEHGNLNAFLTGISRDADAESRVRNVAALADIESFAIFDHTGAEVYRSRSDRYKWLLRDRPGGIRSGDAISQAVLAKQGDWQIVQDDGHSNPSVLSPLIVGGRTVGYVSVVADMVESRYAYLNTLTAASFSLLCVIVLATGVPALVHFRRQRKMAEADERIQFLANHDPLTHLLNRTKMQEETDRVLATARATREHMGYLFIDIDGLSEINDSLGQKYGDELLRTVASRLTATLDKADLLARIGADDFVVLHRRVTDTNELSMLARRIVASAGDPVQIEGHTIRPRISIGIARMPADGRTHGELVKHAELALFHHKAVRSGDFALYDPTMDQEMHRRRQVEAHVRKACEENGFELFYQPIVSGDGLRLLGFEALIRLRDGEGGFISPVEFIPIAEARGYIKSIGTWVLREATRQIAQWPDDLFMSVNLSAVQFRDGDLVDIVRSALADAGIQGSRLEIEVVESLVLERCDDTLGQLSELKALGISIDMDDFGTGYSSLSYLWRFPFDKLKIDQSFMVALEAGESNLPQIIETIISMAHHMKLKVTAEGVETDRQVELLASLGCDQLQGYKFGKPMPAESVAAELLSRFRSANASSTGLAATAHRPAQAIGSTRV